MTGTIVLIGILMTAALAGAQGHQALPHGDLEYMSGAAEGDAAWAVWPRVGEPSDTAGWTVARTDPADGETCLRGEGGSGEFIIGGEGSGRLSGSVSLRAEQPTQANIRLTWFNRWNRTSEEQTVEVGRQWQTYELMIAPDRSGPCELAVAPAGDVAIFADSFSILTEGPPDGERIEDPTPVAHAPIDLAPLQPYAGDAEEIAGAVQLTLSIPDGAQALVPFVSGGVPFPKGALFRREHAHVTDAAGNPVQAQLDVLSRWDDDNSILGLLVTVPADAPDGLRLEWGPNVEATAVEAVAMPEAPDVRPVVLELDGSEGEPARRLEWTTVEREGPLARVTCTRERVGPLMVETRVTSFAGSPRALVSATFVNEGAGTALKGFGLRLPREGAAPILIMTDDGSTPLRGAEEISWGIGASKTEPNRWGLANGDEPTGAVAVPSGGSGIGIAMRDFAENRPSGFTCTQDGLTAWAWPPEAGGFIMSQGLARTVDVLVDAQATGAPAAYRTADLPLLTADAEWICNSGVFNFLMPPDPESFPIFEQTLGSFETLGRFSFEQTQRGNLLGLIDYGDAPGDGGWSNLETMADHEIFLHFYRTLSREHFDVARLAAEHFRDVDIDHRFGYCHTHCAQHTASGEGWSHSWIQGLRDLYLLTGDTRARAVLNEVGERLLSKEPGFTTGRDWTRPIDNLVDIYQVTGDQRYLDCVMAHIEVLGERQIPEESVCGAENGSWYHNRYQAGSAFTWYGCLAMAKLHQNVGGDELARVFLQELDLSMDVETKGKMAFNYYPNEEISEDKRAEEIGVYTLGRGSVLFPAIGYAYRLTGDEKYLRLGMDVLAHCLLKQRSGSDNSATSFITAFLREARDGGYGPEQEREAFERARDFSWAQYPRELANGGFEDGFRHWGVKKVPAEDFRAYQDPIVNVGYFLDSEVAIEGSNALRIHSDNRLRHISVTGQAGLPEGRRWRLTGWMRGDETMNPGMSYSLRSFDDDSRSSGAISATDETRDGWTRHEATFITPARMVMTITLVNRQGTGDVWFDGFELEDLGSVGKLLTENGVGRDRAPADNLLIRTGGTYLPDAPMTGEAKIEGPIPFTEGSLTDGDDGYDYSRQPCSYGYWQSRPMGELLFDFKGTYRIERVSIKVNQDENRHAHGTSKIELLPADSDDPIAVIDEPLNGWNEFEDLDFEAQQLRLRLHQMDGRTYITIAEVQVWGEDVDRP